MRYPVITGDSWESKSIGTVTLFNFIKINRDATTKFKILGEADVTFEGKKVRVFKIQDIIDKGSDGFDTEETWYAAGIGLIYQDTKAYTLELYKFEPGAENK
jgi:hypothetical protein